MFKKVNVYNDNNYLLLTTRIDKSIIDNIESRDYFDEDQKRFFKSVGLNDISYKIEIDYNSYYNQIAYVKTNTNKIIRLSFRLYYDKQNNKIFVNAENEDLLSTFDYSMNSYNDEYNKLKKYIENIKANYDITYNEDTIIKLSNKYHNARDIIDIIDCYYNNCKEFAYTLNFESLIETLCIL